MVIVGSNTAESHPVLATRVKRAHKLRGQKLIVVRSARARDGAARRCLSASQAGHRPGLALARSRATSSTTAWRTRTSSTQWVNGLRRVSARAWSRSRWSMAERAHAALPMETLSKVAHMIAEADSVCILWAMGVTQHVDGLGHIDGDLESAAGHRQLHAARHGRLSAARAQQRAGRERPRRDAQ